MKKILLATAMGAGLIMASAGAANATAYTLDVTTCYDFSYCGVAGAVNHGVFSPSPDTGFLTFTNSGASTFTGTIGYTAVDAGAVNWSQSTLNTFVLNSGDSIYFAINNESSNGGAFNGAVGVTAYLNGAFGATNVNLSVNDADIHSGVVRDPFGDFPTDAFVLQGGDHLGRDTGDNFEVSQAPGHFRFSGRDAGVPEPASWALMILGFGGVGAAVRNRRRSVAAA